MAEAQKSLISSKRGRPRRLTIHQILDAAAAIGLDRLTMGGVAERLGVAKPVLYNYVSSRSELVELAAVRLLQQQRSPEDCGQSWSRYILEYARVQFEHLVVEGQLLESFLRGGYRPVVEIDDAEEWLRALTTRGFSGSEALHMRRAVNHVIVGGAAHYRHAQALRAAGLPRTESASEAVMCRPPEDVPLLREFVDVFALEPTLESWEYTLLVLLQGFAAIRANAKIIDPSTIDPSDL